VGLRIWGCSFICSLSELRIRFEFDFDSCISFAGSIFQIHDFWCLLLFVIVQFFNFHLLRVLAQNPSGFLTCHVPVCLHCNCLYWVRSGVAVCMQCSYNLWWGDEAIGDRPISCHIHHQSQVCCNTFLHSIHCSPR
jgi:hypothetical protein